MNVKRAKRLVLSDLSLVPNPQVMLVQAVVFLSQVYVINKFMVVPFARLKNLRANATVGAELKSDELKKEIKEVSEQIHGRLSAMGDDIKKLKEAASSDAKKVREAEIARAHKEMTDLVSSTRKSIQLSMEEERKKIGALTDKLVSEVYAKLSS